LPRLPAKRARWGIIPRPQIRASRAPQTRLGSFDVANVVLLLTTNWPFLPMVIPIAFIAPWHCPPLNVTAAAHKTPPHTRTRAARASGTDRRVDDARGYWRAGTARRYSHLRDVLVGLLVAGRRAVGRQLLGRLLRGEIARKSKHCLSPREHAPAGPAPPSQHCYRGHTGAGGAPAAAHALPPSRLTCLPPAVALNRRRIASHELFRFVEQMEPNCSFYYRKRDRIVARPRPLRCSGAELLPHP
jgi:hypothetical protein